VIDAFALALALAGLAAGVTAAVLAALGRFRWARFAPTLAVLEVGLLVQVILDLAGLVRGHHPHEPAAHLAYLVLCLVPLPVAAAQTRGDDGRWSGLLLALALVIVAVLVVRLQTTWRPAHA
jgi:hypothetical protein